MTGRCGAGRFLLVMFVTALAGQQVLANDTLYRYRNADNVLVIDFSIPPEYAVKGYEVITPDGRIIETVSAVSEKPSVDQRAKTREQQRLDQFILQSYSTVEDVHQARERRLTLLGRELEILEGNIRELGRRHRQLRDQAASYQASGVAPPEATETVMKELREQERNTEQLLAERRVQYRDLAARYDFYAARLVELKGDAALTPRPQEDPAVSKGSPPEKPDDT